MGGLMIFHKEYQHIVPIAFGNVIYVFDSPAGQCRKQ